MSNVYNIDDKQRRPVPQRSLSETVRDARDEVAQFVNIRVAMLLSELKEKRDLLKNSLPFLIAGGLLVFTTWLLFTGAMVSIIAVALAPLRIATFLGFIITASVYAVVGFSLLWIGRGRLKSNNLLPERTLKVLKEDKIWLENEARTQL